MAKSIAQALKGREDEILFAVDHEGIEAVMERLGIRNRPAFARWLETQRHPLLRKLAGMEGGAKQLFYRTHRETILDCLEIFGRDSTMLLFNISSSEQLEKIISGNLTRSGTSDCYYPKYSKTDQAELRAKIAIEGNRALRHDLDLMKIEIDSLRDRFNEIRELKKLFGEFTQEVGANMTEMLIRPLLQTLTKGDLKLSEKPDPLSVERVMESANKLTEGKTDEA